MHTPDERRLAAHPFMPSPSPGYQDFCWKFEEDQEERCGWPANDHRPATPEEVTKAAGEAFWAMVAAMNPTATTGDLGPVETARFSRVTASAVEEWMALNVPEEDTDGQ